MHWCYVQGALLELTAKVALRSVAPPRRYEAWTAPVHKLKSVTMANNTLQLTQPFATTWVDQASGHRYYFQVRA